MKLLILTLITSIILIPRPSLAVREAVITKPKPDGVCEIFNETTESMPTAITHSLVCGMHTNGAVAATVVAFYVIYEYEVFAIMVHKGNQSPATENIAVMLRVDHNQLDQSSWINAKDAAIKFLDKNSFLSVLAHISQGHHLYITVGDQSGTIALTTSTQTITDFKRHVAYLLGIKDIFLGQPNNQPPAPQPE